MPIQVIDSKMAGGCYDVWRVADSLLMHRDGILVGTLRSVLNARFADDDIPYGPLGKAVRHYHILRHE